MMQFVARVGHVDAAHDFSILRGARIDIHNLQRVRLLAVVRTNRGYVGERFGWRLAGKLG
jgi:hypothetical protein